MDVTQEAGVSRLEIKEEEPGNPEAEEGKEGAGIPKMAGRGWKDVGHKVKQEPDEEPPGNWDVRLQEFLTTLRSTGEAPPLLGQKQGNSAKISHPPLRGMAEGNKWPKGLWVPPNQPRLIGEAEEDNGTQLKEKEKEGILVEDPVGAEIQCRRFRTLTYEDVEGPRELCGRLLKLCRQWLKPERHTKEQILELVTLEQFLDVLPLDMQSWLRQNDPATCAEAATLAEDFLLSRQEARDWERKVLGMSEEGSHGLPDMKAQIFGETKQEKDENVKLMTGDEWLRESEDGQPLLERPERTEPLAVLKTDEENDLLLQGEAEEKDVGQNGREQERGEEPLVHAQDVCKYSGETTIQQDENIEYNEGEKIFGQSVQFLGHENPTEEVKSYKCWHCGQSFDSSSDLLIHERNHVGEQLYKCSHCGGSERIHMGRKPRKCSHCGNTFGCNPQQETNGETKLHTCSECGEKYIHISGLLRHQKTHRGEKAYKCLKCGENFGTYSGLRAHWRTHTGENQYKCLQCEMCFSGITRLRAHEKVHMALCSSCGKTFSQKSELIEHERTHARENSFLCLDCGKAFEFHSELVAHVRTHRDKKLECPDSKNTLICSECGDTFRHSSALKAHQRVHRAMESKKPSAHSGKREQILVEEKKAMIKKYDNGMRIIDIAKMYGRPRSTVATIIQHRKKFMERAVAKGVTRLAKQRSPVLDEVEKLLLLWIRDRQQASNNVTEAIIREKARQLHADLIAQQPGPSDDDEDVFTASSGWFTRFKRRSEIHKVVRHGEAAGSNVPAAEDFATTFYELIQMKGYLPQQVFNADETGLFWKRMTKRTFVTEEATSLSGHKEQKDRLTLLFCANASGDLKVKPLLVYNSLNPRAFKKHRVSKDDLGVFWRATKNAWVTQSIFVAWVNHIFGPSVRRYLEDKNLPVKAVLLLDNCPAHSPDLEKELKAENRFINIVYLPPNTTPILQPMDQQVIRNFKKLYTRELFMRCVDVTGGSRLTIEQFWKEHFDIVDCLNMIKRAWDGISQQKLVVAWRPLWPDSSLAAAEPEAATSEQLDNDAVVSEIIELGRSVGLEMGNDDVEELVDSHDLTEMSTQELIELQRQEEELLESSADEGEEGGPKKRIADLPTSELKAWLEAHDVYQRLMAYHPLKETAVDFFAMDAASLVPVVKEELKKRGKQQMLGRWFKKQKTDTEPSCSAGVKVLSSSSS